MEPTTTTTPKDRPKVDWERDIQTSTRDVERAEGGLLKIEARLSRLPLGRPVYSISIGGTSQDGKFRPSVRLPIRTIRGEICAPSVASAVGSAIAELEAWAVQDAMEFEEKNTRRQAGIRSPGKTAKDKAKRRDPALKTNDPTLSQKRGVGK